MKTDIIAELMMLGRFFAKVYPTALDALGFIITKSPALTLLRNIECPSFNPFLYLIRSCEIVPSRFVLAT